MGRLLIPRLLPLLAFTGCSFFDWGRGCDLQEVPGISVTVIDSITSASVPTGSVAVIAMDGSRADSVRIVGAAESYGLVAEQPGTYTVRVLSDGYRPWEKQSVRVTHDGCHVRTVRLVARLQK